MNSQDKLRYAITQMVVALDIETGAPEQQLKERVFTYADIYEIPYVRIEGLLDLFVRAYMEGRKDEREAERGSDAESELV